MNFFKAVVFSCILVFYHEALSILPHRLLTETTASGLNQTVKTANNVPHVYYVNLDKASDRKKSTQNLLDGCGYKYTRIKAFTPKDLFKEFPLNFSTPKLRNREIGREMLKSCTISHMKAIYTAVRDYKLATVVHNSAQKVPHYALIIEDDIRFLFDFHDWKAFIESAPEGWDILQLVNSNAPVSWYYYDKIWVNSSRLWELRYNNKFWSTSAYLINLNGTLRSLFGDVTQVEQDDVPASFKAALNATSRRHCNLSDTSFSARLRRKGGNSMTADRFIYELGMPNTYISNIPLIGLAEGLMSTISAGHNTLQSTASSELKRIAVAAAALQTLPSYLTPTACDIDRNT